jgi:hypothetical protein
MILLPLWSQACLEYPLWLFRASDFLCIGRQQSAQNIRRLIPENQEIFPSMWIFWHDDAVFLDVRRNGHRSSFSKRHPVQRGAIDSCNWFDIGSPATNHFVDIEPIDLPEVRYSTLLGILRWCRTFEIGCSRYNDLGGVALRRVEGTGFLYSHYVSLFSSLRLSWRYLIQHFCDGW